MTINGGLRDLGLDRSAHGVLVTPRGAIKRQWDPAGILNPGKALPLPSSRA